MLTQMSGSEHGQKLQTQNLTPSAVQSPKLILVKNSWRLSCGPLHPTHAATCTLRKYNYVSVKKKKEEHPVIHEWCCGVRERRFFTNPVTNQLLKQNLFCNILSYIIHLGGISVD